MQQENDTVPYELFGRHGLRLNVHADTYCRLIRTYKAHLQRCASGSPADEKVQYSEESLSVLIRLSCVRLPFMRWLQNFILPAYYIA